MVRNYSNILVAITAVVVVGLVLAPSSYFLGASTLEAATPSESQSLRQNGNTQNHFIIDKSQFKKAPEFTGITGSVNTAHPISLADLEK
jgi:hypothetical protein